MGGGGQVKFFAYEKGSRKTFGSAIFPFCSPLPHPVINDQSIILVNSEDLFLLSRSEIKQELCEFMVSGK